MNVTFPVQELVAHGICPARAVVCGSSPIAARFADFREPGDIDVVVAFREFVKLLFSKGWHWVLPARGTSWRDFHVTCDGCEAFFCWKLGREYVRYGTLWRESDVVGDVRFASLSWVKRYKRRLQRDKDVRDLAFLRLHHAR